MPISYVIKRLVRSWQLYIALLLGVLLASTFFAGVNVGADTAAKQALDQALAKVPVDFYINGYQTLSSRNATTLLGNVSATEGVIQAEVISKVYANIRLPNEDYYHTARLVGIQPNSGLAKTLKQGDTIQVNMTMPFYQPDSPEPKAVSYTLNLTVAGFAELDDRASALVQGQYFAYDFSFFMMGPGNPAVIPSYIEDLLIVDWEKTMVRFVDLFHEISQFFFETDILMYVDRGAVISIWDIPGSLNRLETLRRKIEQQVSRGGFGLPVAGGLQGVLTFSQMMLTMMRLAFIAVSLPVFFVAWYMGTTVSDVSFNLRRREIGLLLTKGFSRSQLFRMFLTEALLIGLAGGLVGIALSLALNPVFVRAVGGEFSGTPVIGTDTAILTVAFSVIIIILAVFRPARRASNLSTVDALREYIYVEDVKPYKKFWPWLAFILGTYKMIILLLGINLLMEVTRLGMAGGNFLLILLAGIWAFFDYYILTAIGPVLFFWGCTKVFIRGSLKFQEVTARPAKFLGDLGTLATRNVQRNPARAASIAFLIALIIGYGIQITGTLASDQDYNIRTVYANVGADVRVDSGSPVNVTATMDLMNKIHTNVSGVAPITPEYSFSGTSSFGG